MMFNTQLSYLLAFMSCFVGALTAGAVTPPATALKLGVPFVDGAVLQREMSVPVWGWCKPGTKVTVEFAGQSKSATTDQEGKWMVELDPLKASFDAAEMKVRDDAGQSVSVKDVLVGEVWLASGQSNMQWTADKCDVGRVLQAQIAQRVKTGQETPPVIREGRVTNRFAALFPLEHAEYEWSDEGGQFSAIAYAFSYSLYKELQVPIGILNCSFSQTSIQSWTPRVGFRDGQDEYTKNIQRQLLESDPATPEHKAAWGKFYQDIEDTLKQNAQRVKDGEEPLPISTATPGNLNGNRDATWLYNARTHPVAPYAMRGCIWNQGYANMGEGLVYYNNLHSLIRGWRLVWNRPDLPVIFHQFYTPGSEAGGPAIGGASDMRLGTWLARDIPHTAMASQIDIGGAIHYVNKTLPGMRMALHALKNQYGKKLVADGPMFKSYEVQGDKLIVELDHAQGGLLVGETKTNSSAGLAIPTVIPNGQEQVKLFYLADENRLWHLAQVMIDGERLILTSANVKSPRGVSYASGGVAFVPNIYNSALLPMTPFIYYDNKLVTAATWPDEQLKVAGVEIDPSTMGLLHLHRKLPLLSSQFVDNAVLQADQPVVIWGSAQPEEHLKIEGQAEVHFSFAGVEKTIPVTPGMKEWRVTLPPMPASAQPRTLKVSYTINGELAHERRVRNIVFGEVWYVAASMTDVDMDSGDPDPNVRMITRRAKRDSNPAPSRFSVSVSTAPDNRFASLWEPATGLAGVMGKKIAGKTHKPVGIVFMRILGGKEAVEPELKGWIKAQDLGAAPSLRADYAQLMSLVPGNEYYDANARRYVQAWQNYWDTYIPELIRTKAMPDDKPWGSYPGLAADVTTKASEVYNVMVESFAPGSFKGIVFLTGPGAVETDQGQHFAEQMTVLANSWKKRFACEDPVFFYLLPSQTLAPKLTPPASILGKSHAIELTQWPKNATEASAMLTDVIDQIIAKSSW